MVPFLAAYIGYSISDRAALAPCAIGAWVGNSFGAGFFGALIAGIIGGLVVYYLKKIPVHKVLRSVMPIFVIPIIGTFITAGIMMWGLGEPIGALTRQPDRLAAGHARRQHRDSRHHHGPDAGLRHGRSGE